MIKNGQPLVLRLVVGKGRGGLAEEEEPSSSARCPTTRKSWASSRHAWKCEESYRKGNNHERLDQDIDTSIFNMQRNEYKSYLPPVIQTLPFQVLQRRKDEHVSFEKEKVTNESQMRWTLGTFSASSDVGLYNPSTGGTGVVSSTMARPLVTGHAHFFQQDWRFSKTCLRLTTFFLLLLESFKAVFQIRKTLGTEDAEMMSENIRREIVGILVNRTNHDKAVLVVKLGRL